MHFGLSFVQGRGSGRKEFLGFVPVLWIRCLMSLLTSHCVLQFSCSVTDCVSNTLVEAT